MNYDIICPFKMTNTTAIKNEAYYHDQWDVINLQDQIDDNKEEADSLIDEFCHYDLPSDAKIGGEWDLPDWYIEGNTTPKAPYWKFSFPEFTAYIKAVTPTDDPDILEIEYQLYRSNNAHCSGYYARWCTCKAMVNTKTHRRWNVD